MGFGCLAVKIDTARGPAWVQSDSQASMLDFAQTVRQQIGEEGFVVVLGRPNAPLVPPPWRPPSWRPGGGDLECGPGVSLLSSAVPHVH
eukprot:1754191-Alexandrium_andersonii.AAC.1